MPLSTAVGNQLVERSEVVVNYFSFLEMIDDLRTDIRTATDSRCVTQRIGRLLNRFDDHSLARSAPFNYFGAHPREGTRTNERACPRAEILGAEVFAHYFTNVIVNVMAGDVYKLTIAVLIFEDFA